MTPVDWELDKLGLDIRDGLRLYNPDSEKHCQLTVDGEYDFNVPFEALRQFVERYAEKMKSQYMSKSGVVTMATESSKCNRHDGLVYLVFDNGTFTYTTEFKCVIFGTLWPRELESAWKIVSLYKEQNKLSNRDPKS